MDHDVTTSPVEYPSVQRAKASTSRSSLDLLSLTYPFSQVGLLTASDFAKEAEHRRGRVLHTMGNLTLLTKHLNPAVSNGPWVAKCPEILKRSALSLNRPLAEVAAWDERAIEQRGRVLFKVACQVWPHPAATK